MREQSTCDCSRASVSSPPTAYEMTHQLVQARKQIYRRLIYQHGFTNMDLPTSFMQDLPILHTAFCAHLHLHAQGPLLVELIKNIFLTVL